MADTTDEELLQEMRRIAEKLDKPNLSKKDFREHKEVKGDIKYRFGSWNKAKKKAGLDLYEPELGEEYKEKVLQIAKEVAEKPDEKNTVENISKRTNHSNQPLKKWWYPMSNIFEEVGATPYKKDRSEEEIRQEVRKMEEEKKVVRPTDLTNIASKSKLEDSDIDIEEYKQNMIKSVASYIATSISPGFYGVAELRKEIKKGVGFKPFFADCTFEEVKQFIEEEIQDDSIDIKKHDGGRNTRIYVDKGKFGSEEKYRALMRAKWEDFKLECDVEFSDSRLDEDELFELFIELTGTGKQPATIFGSIVYVETDMSQYDIEDCIDVTDVSIRNTYHMVEEELGKV